MRRGLIRWRTRRGLAAGAAVFALVLMGLMGCDNTEVQTVIWQGLNDLAAALVDAVFQAFKPGTDVAPVTVSWLMDAVRTAMA